MKQLIKRKINMILLIVSVFIMMYVVVNRLVLQIPLFDSFKFIVYMVMFILPGVTLLRLFRLQMTPLLSFVFAFTLSLALLFLLYLVFSLLKLSTYYFLIPIIMDVFGFIGILLLRSRPLYIERDTNEFVLGISLAFISLMLVQYFLSTANLTPNITGPRQYHVDLLNSVGLVTSAEAGFPFMDIKAAGIPYIYHVLPFSFLAVMKSVTSFSSFDLITNYSLTVFTPFCVLALVALVKKLTKKNIYILLTFLILFILSPFENNFLWYMYTDTLGFSLAVGLGVVSVISFLIAYEEEQVFSSFFIFSLISFGLATAAKGPIAAIYLVGFGFSLFISFFTGKKVIMVILRGLTLLAVFGFTYFIVYSKDTAGLVLWYPGRYVYDTNMFRIVENSTGEKNAILTITMVQLITYCFMTLSFICLTILILLKFRKLHPFVGFSFGSILCGCLMTHLTHQYGGSEIYFILAAYAFSVIGLFFVIERIIEIVDVRKRVIILLPVLFLLSVCFAISFSPAVRFFADGYEAAIHYKQGNPGRIDDEYKLMAIDHKRFDYITDYEYEAMQWIKKNTPKNSVIVSDRVLKHNKYMYYSAFSERIFFLEGYVYITSYDEESLYYDEIQKRIGILEQLYDNALIPSDRYYTFEYIIVSNWQNPGLVLNLETVFENRDITVYKV